MNTNELAKKAIKELSAEIQNDDQEIAHINADIILCNLLYDLGLGVVVEEYHKIAKWYA